VNTTGRSALRISAHEGANVHTEDTSQIKNKTEHYLGFLKTSDMQASKKICHGEILNFKHRDT
jgi:hypothetical protein